MSVFRLLACLQYYRTQDVYPARINPGVARGSDVRLIKVLLHGLRGPITINKEVFNRDSVLERPSMAMAPDDAKIAGVITCVRREFGDGASPVEVSAVQKLRDAHKGRTEQWTEKDLK